MNYILETKKFKRSDNQWVEIKDAYEVKNYTPADFQTKVVDASSFFEGLGGTEKTINTPTGRKQISISPNGLEKYTFELKKGSFDD